MVSPAPLRFLATDRVVAGLGARWIGTSGNASRRRACTLSGSCPLKPAAVTTIALACFTRGAMTATGSLGPVIPTTKTFFAFGKRSCKSSERACVLLGLWATSAKTSSSIFQKRPMYFAARSFRAISSMSAPLTNLLTTSAARAAFQSWYSEPRSESGLLPSPD